MHDTEAFGRLEERLREAIWCWRADEEIREFNRVGAETQRLEAIQRAKEKATVQLARTCYAICSAFGCRGGTDEEAELVYEIGTAILEEGDFGDDAFTVDGALLALYRRWWKGRAFESWPSPYLVERRAVEAQADALRRLRAHAGVP